MSASTAIGMVSESLRNLLDEKMEMNVGVTVLAPDESGSEPRINLFLYKIQENLALKNLDWQVKSGDSSTLTPPPLSLNLFYLMTPYAVNDQETGNATAHMILGEAMRVFYENPIVPYQDDPLILVEGLRDAREQVKIMLNSLDLDELSQVWNTFTEPFRLSVMYEVSVVQLEQLPASERPLPQRVRRIGVPRVEAPYRPPIVDHITPTNGPTGTAITFQGQNFIGWRAYVTLTGHLITSADGQALTADATFTVTIPTDLDLTPGFHEIQVDISHLYRRTFFFEIEAAP